MNKKKQTIIAIAGIIGLIAITFGATYAFISYAKQGTKQNTIRSGNIEFLYTEVDGIGAGISLEDAMPMTDPQGMAQMGTNGHGYFDFKITSSTALSTSIPYTVTARVKGDSTLDSSVVKVYLSDPNTNQPIDGYTTTEAGTGNEVASAKYFSEPTNSTGKTWLPQYTGTSYASNYTEKVLYSGLVPAGSNSPSYEKDFRLRIWIADDTDFSPRTVETKAAYCTDDNNSDAPVTTVGGNPADATNCKDGYTWHEAETEIQYPYNGKTFTITINVYANGEAVADNYNASNISYTTSYNSNVHTVADALDDLTSILGS